MSVCELKAQAYVLCEPLLGESTFICQENLGFEEFILSDGENYIDRNKQIYMVKKENIWVTQASGQESK